MRYINPFPLFRLSESDPLDTLTVEKIQQRLSNISPKNEQRSGQIKFMEELFSPEEIATITTEWQSSETRELHRKVFQYKKLFNFLEFGHLGLFRDVEAQKNEVWTNKAFIEFITPYLVAAYSENLEQAVRLRDSEAMESLLHHQLPIQFSSGTSTHSDEKKDPVVEHLKKNIDELVGLAEKENLSMMSERELVSYLSDKSIAIYNTLPDNCAPLRNQLGMEVQQLALLLNNELGRSDGAEALVRQGLKLKLDDELEQALQSMLTHHRRAGGIPLWLIIGLGIMALLFFIQYLERN